MFISAKPIWAKGCADRMNTQVACACTVDACPGMLLRITGATFYRIFVDGQFLHFGPARTARGYARVDELPISANKGKVKIVIEAMGYRCNTLSTINQPSFIQAELVAGDKVIAFTGRDFSVHLPETHLQKVQRVSKQRHFTEVWDFRTAPIDPALGKETEAECLSLDLSYLPRRVDLPDYTPSPDAVVTQRGKLVYDPDAHVIDNRYSGKVLPEGWGFFAPEEIPYRPYPTIQRYRQEPTGSGELPMTLAAGEYVLLDLKQIYAGFFRTVLDSAAESDVIIGFSEFCPPDRFEFGNINMHTVLEYLLAPGSYDHLSFEPYTARYAIVAVMSGNITLRSLSMTSFAYPIPEPVKFADAELNHINRAACRTFAHNAVDLYVDCPSRERAGWLCDSYFTAQAEYSILGSSKIESAFLENFVLRGEESPFSPDVKPIPREMIPMCYPADQNGTYIPQWAMWLVLELEQYFNHRVPDADREQFRPMLEKLMGWFAGYENDMGLLERLPGWNFVEWSKANKWTQDLNYPTNMLYAETLECMDKIYGTSDRTAKANAIRRKVAELSFDGEFFHDHALRGEDGQLHNCEDISEVCQYYALRFGVADPKDPRYAGLMRTVLEVFGPRRTDALPHIERANALMGVYLRMELLWRWGERQHLLDDIHVYFGGKADTTGTLWEYTTPKGSLDHGFASYVTVVLNH